MLKIYKESNKVVHFCEYVASWCTKYNRPILDPYMREEAKKCIQFYLKECDAEILELEVFPERVFIRLLADPGYGIDKTIRHAKARSAGHLKTLYPGLKTRLPALWTNSYFVTTDTQGYMEAYKNYVNGRPSTSLRTIFEEDEKPLKRKRKKIPDTTHSDSSR